LPATIDQHVLLLLPSSLLLLLLLLFLAQAVEEARAGDILHPQQHAQQYQGHQSLTAASTSAVVSKPLPLAADVTAVKAGGAAAAAPAGCEEQQETTPSLGPTPRGGSILPTPTTTVKTAIPVFTGSPAMAAVTTPRSGMNSSSSTGNTLLQATPSAAAGSGLAGTARVQEAAPTTGYGPGFGLTVSAPVLRQLSPNHPLLSHMADESYELHEDAADALEQERQAMLAKAAQLEQECAAHAAAAAQAEAMRASAAARAAVIEEQLKGEMSARRQQLLQQQEVSTCNDELCSCEHGVNCRGFCGVMMQVSALRHCSLVCRQLVVADNGSSSMLPLGNSARTPLSVLLQWCSRCSVAQKSAAPVIDQQFLILWLPAVFADTAAAALCCCCCCLLLAAGRIC
jgi:hypothetical protein